MGMNDQQQPGFFDRNTFTAIILSFAVFFAWQMYMAKKYPQTPKTGVEITGEKSPEKQGVALPSEPGTGPVSPAPTDSAVKPATPEDFKIETQVYENENFVAEISSLGMGFKRLELKKFTDRNNKPIEYGSVTSTPLLATSVNDQHIYALKKISDTEYEGSIENDQWSIRKRVTFDPAKYLAQVTMNIQAKQKQKLTVTSSVSGKVAPISRSFLLPAYEYQEFFIAGADENMRQMLDPDKEFTGTMANTKTASFNSQYFAMAMTNRSELLPKASVAAKGGVGTAVLSYETPQPVDAQELKFDFYFGPKKMEVLRTVDEDLKYLIDYGFFGFIGRPLLWLMRTVHQVISNWGIAIIIVTILLRMVLLPINVYSFRSMKKMQKIQPKIQTLKEKFKNDPQRLNQETLALMRAEKANPLNGCLPALMQIPIFFALYQMLGKSFELYKQPFAFWIHDLSIKDPYFVLPILAGAMFFVQQKMTPTTSLDPVQAKVLLVMPLIFTVFMLSVPSGLTLYMFVNSLFGIFQQIVFMRERTT